MKKLIKIGFPIVCIAIIGGTFVLLDRTTSKINRNKLSSDESNIYDENVIETEVSNGEEVLENMVNSEDIKIKEIDNKAKAIELVKRLSPPLTNVYYTNEGKVEDNYLVAVRDSETQIIKIYYVVDINNEKIEIYEK